MAGMLYATPGPNFVGHPSIYQFVFEPIWSAPVPAATGMGSRAIAC